MTDNLDLARRAVTCRHWQWVDGMQPIGVMPDCFDYPRIGSSWNESSGWMSAVDCKLYGLVPDLTDPATIGCLLALVREAWGDPSMHTQYWPTPDMGGKQWIVKDGSMRSPRMRYLTEAAALVAALEAAP